MYEKYNKNQSPTVLKTKLKEYDVANSNDANCAATASEVTASQQLPRDHRYSMLSFVFYLEKMQDGLFKRVLTVNSALVCIRKN